ncbi:MAG TPA: hypothetical protein VLA36_03170 [Longimicrobiales bacterium]|nr:hypothetical protein [Longimicrobiales bacterium]
MRHGRRIAWGALGLLLLVGGSWATQSPVFAALAKSKKDFAPLPTDARVRFEPGAEAMATRIGAFLDTAIATVEATHGRPFREAFTVYVCATQRSLNEFLALPPGAPIRGTVLFGQVFLAPSAFDWQGDDVHRESLTHELSHLHLRQNLGLAAHRGEIPPWFNEALADLVSGAGGEGIPTEEAVRAIVRGPALRPDSTGNLWSLQRTGTYGLSGPMLHKQSRMFIEYLRDRDPAGFPAFLTMIQEKRTFAAPFREHFGGSVEDLWTGFVESLRTDDTPDP